MSNVKQSLDGEKIVSESVQTQKKVSLSDEKNTASKSGTENFFCLCRRTLNSFELLKN